MNTITTDQEKKILKISAKNKVSFTTMYAFFVYEANVMQLCDLEKTANEFALYIKDMRADNYISVDEFEVVTSTEKAILIKSTMPRFEKWIPKSQMVGSFFPTWTLSN